MSKPELTGEQIKEIQKKYRYIRFISDLADSKKFILQGANYGFIKRDDKIPWEDIEVPEIKGKSRSTLRFYALQIIDLQSL